MSWQQALELVVAQTQVERYRYLCNAPGPDREFWRAEMIRMASGQDRPAPPSETILAFGWVPPCCG